MPAISLHGKYLGEISWGTFAGNLVIGGASKTPSVPQLTEGGVTITYAQTTETSANCTLQDTGTGEVSAGNVDMSASPVCTLSVTVSKTGFSSQVHEISIPLAVGE